MRNPAIYVLSIVAALAVYSAFVQAERRTEAVAKPTPVVAQNHPETKRARTCNHDCDALAQAVEAYEARERFLRSLMYLHDKDQQNEALKAERRIGKSLARHYTRCANERG